MVKALVPDVGSQIIPRGKNFGACRRAAVRDRSSGGAFLLWYRLVRSADADPRGGEQILDQAASRPLPGEWNDRRVGEIDCCRVVTSHSSIAVGRRGSDGSSLTQ